jgi:hypothetical protein
LVLTALSGTDWGWANDLLQKVYLSRLLSGAIYAGGEWLPWLSATCVDTLNWAQNRKLRVITGQLESTPNEALRVEKGFQSFGWLRDCAAAVYTGKVAQTRPGNPLEGHTGGFRGYPAI